MKTSSIFAVTGILLIVFLFNGVGYAGGLSSNWGEVVIDNVQPGKAYDLNKAAGFAFTLTNNFDTEVSLNLRVLKPEENELKPGYEPITDEGWISIPQNIIINPLQKEVVPIKLKIPDDAKLRGRKFHAWVWSYTSGQAVGVGLKSRILINVSGMNK